MKITHEPLAPPPPTEPWSLGQADALYRVSAWSEGYFVIGDDGRLAVRRSGNHEHSVPLDEIRQRLEQSGLSAPMVVRFNHILRDRVESIAGAFEQAMQRHQFRGEYRLLFPVKVNQQRHVVEQIHRQGARHGFGLEVGSKPELLAALALTAGESDRPIVCNGFKDERYLELAMLAFKLGRQVIPIVESYSEIEILIGLAKRHAVRPMIGARVKLAASGAGRWQASSGSRAKFGLEMHELLSMFARLQEHAMTGCFQLLHCHVGSQVHDIQAIDDMVDEAGQIYVELKRMGANLHYLDVGGGLGVDYDGSQQATSSSINYNVQEYANRLVARVAQVCDRAGIEHPTLLTESGRAVAAHHSVLIVDVVSASCADSPVGLDTESASFEPNADTARPVADMQRAYQSINCDNYWSKYQQAGQARGQALRCFAAGRLDLRSRVVVERMYQSICVRVRDLAAAEGDQSEGVINLQKSLCATYFANFSLFQSLPDSWAIDQLFPIVPLTRLNERPDQPAVLADMTCDSDGKIARFVGPDGPQASIDLHSLQEGEPYPLGIFLVGAYQETLGDWHNLFGNTHVAHVELHEDGTWEIEATVAGDSVSDVLSEVQYDVDELLYSLGREYEACLAGYTYLETHGSNSAPPSAPNGGSQV